jgi:dCTP deaminase
MILSDTEIEFLSTKMGMITPYHPGLKEAGLISYGQTSFGYDIRAGYEWKIFTDKSGAIIDPKNPTHELFYDVAVLHGERVVIPPNSYALTHSLETIKMPRNVTGVCLGKSTYARCGIHVNVTPLEAGWQGVITIEVSNATRLPVYMYPGEGIMQVLFFQGAPPRVSYADRGGKYMDQTGVTLARIREEDVKG